MLRACCGQLIDRLKQVISALSPASPGAHPSKRPVHVSQAVSGLSQALEASRVWGEAWRSLHGGPGHGLSGSQGAAWTGYQKPKPKNPKLPALTGPEAGPASSVCCVFLFFVFGFLSRRPLCFSTQVLHAGFARPPPGLWRPAFGQAWPNKFWQFCQAYACMLEKCIVSLRSFSFSFSFSFSLSLSLSFSFAAYGHMAAYAHNLLRLSRTYNDP